MFNGFSHSVMGASHEKKGTVCQDSSAFIANDRYAVAVVADGHGSKKHFRSNIGSKSAVEATLETIENFFNNADDFEERFPKNPKLIIKGIEKQVIARWNKKINEHLKENPVTKEEKKEFTIEEFKKIAVESYYGSTLIAAIICEKFSFGFQIGDGSLVAVFDDGETLMPIGDDESAPANITASLCNSNASSMFNSFFENKKTAAAVFTSTDGLYTSFGSDNDFLDYHTIISSQLSEIENFEGAIVKNLTKRSHFGTEDDTSLSCVYNKRIVDDNNSVLVAKVDENKRLAAERKARMLNRTT